MHGQMTQTAEPLVLVVSEPLAGTAVPEGIRLQAWPDFLASLVEVNRPGDPVVFAIADATVAGLLLTSGDASDAGGRPGLAALFDAADLPLIDLGDAPAAADLPARIVELLAARLAAARDMAQRERAAAAALRAEHMQIQRDFSDVQQWIHYSLAPEFKLARDWPPTAATVPAGSAEAPLVQPLPVAFRGFAALDLHLAVSAPAAGHLCMELVRPVGGALAAPVRVRLGAGEQGWVRLPMVEVGGGAPEDAEARLWFEPDDGGDAPLLSLAPEIPFADLCLRRPGNAAPAPLAMKLYQSLPRLPLPPLHDPRRGVAPAAGDTVLVMPGDLEPPRLLPFFADPVRRGLRSYPDHVDAAYWEDRNAFHVHPSAARPVVALAGGLTVERLSRVSAVVSIQNRESLEVAFAVGAVPAGSVASGQKALPCLGEWIRVLPGEWAEAWCDLPDPLSGAIDLVMAVAMPGAPLNRDASALFRGFRLTSLAQAGDGAGDASGA